jgi:drug/metabolite transporter (DMT)-like permease
VNTANPTAVYFGDAILHRLKAQSAGPRVFTLIGGVAVALWATWPILSLRTQSIPSLECMTLIFIIAWLTLKCLPVRFFVDAQPPAAGPGSWIPVIAFAIGESGSTVFFLLAIRHIAAAEANLLIFLWPAMTVGLGAMLGIFRLRARHLGGIALGFLGVAVLTNVSLSASVRGIALALLGSMSWAFYCVFRLKWSQPSGPVLARGFLLSAAVCGALHFCLEATVLPDAPALMAAVLIGVVPTGIANALWDQAFRCGDSRLLAVMAYGTPLCAGALLCAFGYQTLSPRLLFGAIAIVAAGLLSRGGAAEIVN